MKNSSFTRLAWSLVLFALPLVSRAVPYASSVSESAGTVTFYLNEAADNVKVVFSGPGSTLDLGALARGSYNLPRGTAASYQIEVTKSAPPLWTQISDDTNALLQFFAPISLSVNRNPASTNFGRIYVLEDGGQVGGGRLTSEGIFVLNADISDAFAQGNTGLQAGLGSFNIFAGTGGSDRYDPFQIEVGDDDYIYISDANDPRGGVLRADPTVTTGEPVLEGIGNAVATNIHTVLYGIHTKGSLSAGNLKVWCTDGQWLDNGNPANNSILRWDIGAGPLPYNTPPVLVAEPGPTASERDSDLDVAPDGNVFFTVSIDGGSGATGVPAVQVFSSTGTPLWNSLIGGVDVFTNAYSLEVSPDNTKLAIIRRDRQTWVVGLTNGPNGRLPDLSTTNLLATFTVGSGNGRSIAWDLAGNLYVGNRSTERVRIFSPGGTTTAITRSAGTFSITVPANTVSISNSLSLISEGDATPVVFTVRRTGNTAEPLTASFLLTGTASDGVDHATFPASITFPAGVTTSNISIAITDDTTAEFSETLTVAVNSGTNYSAGTPASASVTILDNETPEISLALAQTESRLLEGYAPSKVGFQLSRKGLLSGSVTANIAYAGTASAGTDFNGPPSVHIDSNIVTAVFNITPINDGNYEGSETATVSVAGGSGYTIGTSNSASATVIDDDPSPGMVLFSDDFETNSAPRWIVNMVEPDAAAEFGFDYSTVYIPAAPGGGSTRGLRFRLNEMPGAPRNAISASPLGLNLTGDYRLRFNMWINYNGPMFDGGPGSTMHITAGVGTTADHANLATSPFSDGVWFGIDGDGGSTTSIGDADAYAGIDLQPDASGVYAAGTNGNPRSTTTPYYSLWGNIQAPAAQLANFPSQTGTSQGGNMGMAWHTVVITKETNTVTWVIDGILIASVPAEFVPLSTNVFVGYQDLFPGASSVPAMSFALVDNLRVETLVAPAEIRITGIQIIGGNVQIDFFGAASDTISSFTLQNSGTVNGTYADVSSTIAQLGPGAFRATIAAGASSQFYRIRHN